MLLMEQVCWVLNFNVVYARLWVAGFMSIIGRNVVDTTPVCSSIIITFCMYPCQPLLGAFNILMVFHKRSTLFFLIGFHCISLGTNVLMNNFWDWTYLVFYYSFFRNISSTKQGFLFLSSLTIYWLFPKRSGFAHYNSHEWWMVLLPSMVTILRSTLYDIHRKKCPGGTSKFDVLFIIAECKHLFTSSYDTETPRL